MYTLWKFINNNLGFLKTHKTSIYLFATCRLFSLLSENFLCVLPRHAECSPKVSYSVK